MDIKNAPKITECHNPGCNNTFKTAYSKGQTLKKYCTFDCFVSMSRIVLECARPECTNTFNTRKSDNRKYCSRSCNAQNQNVLRDAGSGLDPRNSRRLTSSCKRCANPISSVYRYCPDCSSTRTTWERDEKAQKWVDGYQEVATGSNGQLLEWARDYLIGLAGNKCSRCSWCEPNVVLGRPILTVDHKDGNWRNNDIGNLVVLCYNCHSVTDTWGTLNRSSAGVRPRSGNRYDPQPTGFSCVDCGIEVSRGAARCQEHAAHHRKSKIDWPDAESLIESVKSSGFEATGRLYGVTGASVRKRLRKLGYDTVGMSSK